MRKHKSEKQQAMINAISGKYSEPEFTGLVWTQIDLSRALSHYAANTDFDKMKSYALQYAKNNLPDIIENIEKLHPTSFMTYGPLCRLSSRGFTLTEELKARIRYHFSAEIEKNCVIKERQSTSKINKASFALDVALEDTLNEGKVCAPFFLESGSTTAAEKVCRDELGNLKDFPDYFKPKQIPLLKKFYTAALEAIGVTKKDKKRTVVRKKKVIQPSVIVKSVKYKKEDSTLGLTSINPADVIGKKKMYVYDASRRELRMYVSLSEFTFKGTTLLNVDFDKSVCKKIRKPEVFFAGDIKTLSGINKAFGLIKGKDNPLKSSRFNEDSIILRTN